MNPGYGPGYLLPFFPSRRRGIHVARRMKVQAGGAVPVLGYAFLPGRKLIHFQKMTTGRFS
jgi:hypothetical protein